MEGCGGQQHDFGFDTRLDDVLHQAFIPAFLDDVTLFVALAFDVIAEVVGFVDDDQVKVSPVDGGQVDVTCFTRLTGEVGVRQHSVGKTVADKRVQFAGVLGQMHGPIFA